MAGKNGIGFDPEYSESHELTLLPVRDFVRFWTLPHDPACWPHFAGSLLVGLDSWKHGYLVPRFGQWPRQARSLTLKDAVRNVILRGLGIPDGWNGAVRVDADERNEVVAILFTYFAFCGSSNSDLYFVPDHCNQILQANHHDVVYIECQSEERVQEFVRRMAEKQYALPTKLPDWTFIRPRWMPLPSTPSE